MKIHCPLCNGKNVALIFWGYPADMDWYLKAIDEKKIVGGGCCTSENDPKWECIDCYHRWGQRYFRNLKNLQKSYYHKNERSVI